jgi:hypothetical protein
MVAGTGSETTAAGATVEEVAAACALFAFFGCEVGGEDLGLPPLVIGDVKSFTRSINQTQKAIERGKAPKTVIRADKGRVPGEQDNIHFNDGSAINRDGTWKHGGRSLTNPEKKFLQESGFKIP